MLAVLFAVIALLGPLVALHTNGYDFSPGPKRSALFEDEDGNRKNPFSGPDGDTGGQPRCRRCGTALDAATYRFCSRCPTPSSAGD